MIFEFTNNWQTRKRVYTMPANTENLLTLITLLIIFSISITIIILSSVSGDSVGDKLTIHHIGGNLLIPKTKKYLPKNVQIKPIRNKTASLFYNEWFRKYFQLFDYEGHIHHKSLPSYYPIKAQKLFTKYIILSQVNDKYKCKLKMITQDMTIITPSPTFKHFKIGETSSDYWIDYDLFNCETLLTLNGYLLWKINFFIIENSSIIKNKTIRDFEIRINAHDYTHPRNLEILRSAGKVRDPSYDSTNKRWKYPADFYIHEPNLYHTIYPIHTYNNRYFEFTQSISPDLGREYPLELFENNTNHSLINTYYETKFFQPLHGLRKMNVSFNVDDYLSDFKEMEYIGSTLQNTPFLVMIQFGEYNHSMNTPKYYCDAPQFHFDSYQSEIPNEIVININSEIVRLSTDSEIYVLPKRIGRWFHEKPWNFGEGKWMEPDCEWKRYELLDEIEHKIFKDSNMQIRFMGASNYQTVIWKYLTDQCPNENFRDIMRNGLLCNNTENLSNNGITFEWQYFRGSCMYWPYNKDHECADIWSDRIVNRQMNEYNDLRSEYSCNKLLGITRQEPNHRLSNITFVVNGLWTQRYSNISHIHRLYQGFEYMLEQCSQRFESRMNEMGFFYKQTFATSAAPTKKFELARFNNHQLDNYIELALKTIMENKPYLIGVLWSFQRTFTRHFTDDRMHQVTSFYDRHNRDIFNELFRYIPSVMHQKCITHFDHDCMMSTLRH